ncbi:tRNA and rRNA cytosine-C5-methylase (RNA methyltransferase) protein [Phenylobacterium zucineum HLK1]|uniref:tRNA and rRNA cytosine-C5-methylase (RNA methyltransferase) protein n=1 Tax=Phenylobacterium zucineum (strain HLK1) TaxID=450851 RepID=B4R9R6_PHEZH|nr:RsmB/NOP family class I SAM-dependent RNA methyltransferase [Phenylobacterium zucineum]ACG77830.1 tRNA and rRNA cytosine-C5-methylase (RNA methyltransferase) protein [Phenylobacterium zucineum HLK1]
MRDGGRLAAAIEVLTEIEARHRPVRLALKAWGEAARYAGAKDRAFVSGLVLDVLRRRRSLAWRMGEEGPRAAALGALRFLWDWPLERIAEAAAEDPHGPGPLSDAERAALETPRDLADAPPAVRGDYPDWLDAGFARAFGEARAEEGAALAERAPVDLRVNTLKTDPERALKALASVEARPTGVLPTALRIAAPDPAARGGAVEAIPQFSKGWFEVQDLGSQIAASAAGEVKGAQVLDLCAGGGGKTLALAAAMGNTGQIYAYDSDARRLTDTVRRGDRAGARNLQVRSPVNPEPLKGLEGRMDVVFVDAPCTGTGSWRRHPDTKWRLTPEALARRQAEQDQVLDDAARFVKAGGRIVYVTCSVLPEEDEDRVEAFLQRHSGFARRAATDQANLADYLTPAGDLRLSPRTSGTDGFFVAVLEKAR